MTVDTSDPPREHRRKDDPDEWRRHFHARSLHGSKVSLSHRRYAGKGCWNDERFHSRADDEVRHNRRKDDPK